MRILPKLGRYGLTGVLSLLLLFSNAVACWAQLVHPMSPDECCAHSACKRMPGQPARSSCQANDADAGQFVAPVVLSSDFSLAALDFVCGEFEASAIRFAAVPRSIDYSPPQLFLLHSSLLI
jgi:hypothetical protein